MDILNEFSKRFTNVARSVSEKSREGAELTRLNTELRAAQEALEKLYARYGKACYVMRSGGGDPDEAEQLAVRVRAAILAVEEAAERRDAVRELKRCLSCGAVHPKEARFCSNCGKKLPEDAPTPEPVEVGEYCPSCGAKREGSEARCPVCGADFEAPAEPEPPRPAEAVVVEGPDVEEPVGDDARWE